MKTGIHPNYVTATVRCACGHTFQTRSTRPAITLEICSNCHPFYTGKQKLIDSAGRVERFTKRFEKTSGKTVRVKAQTKAGKQGVSRSAHKILSTSAKKAKTEKPADKKPASAPKPK